jgi:hypothetical protein
MHCEALDAERRLVQGFSTMSLPRPHHEGNLYHEHPPSRRLVRARLLVDQLADYEQHASIPAGMAQRLTGAADERYRKWKRRRLNSSGK